MSDDLSEYMEYLREKYKPIIVNFFGEITAEERAGLGINVPLEEMIDPLGILVRRTDWSYTYITRELVNWRVREVVPNGTDNRLMWHLRRAWCYPAEAGFLPVMMRALAWDGSASTEPSGWRKSVFDERRHGEPAPGITQQ